MESEVDIIINELSYNFTGIFTFQFGLGENKERYFIIHRLRITVRAIEIRKCNKNFDIYQNDAINYCKIYIGTIKSKNENIKYPFDKLLQSSKDCWKSPNNGYMNLNELKVEINKLDSEELKFLGEQINWYKDLISEQ